jgi:uncharacterized protein (TIGR02301 family)
MNAKRFSFTAAALGITLGLGANAFAQQAQQPRRAAPAPAEIPAPAPLETPPPYERQLLRLSEIMGALEWLTSVCGEDSAAKARGQWRARMAALIESEGATTQRRERLAGSYNRGYQGYEATYRACTPNARLVITRFLDEGGRIARDIGNRYTD